MLENDIIFVKDEYGEEKQMHLLFCFHLDAYQKDYVIFEDRESDEVFMAIALSDQEYIAIEDEQELECVQEVAYTLLTMEE